MIGYIEHHIVDHCNLNCAGCSHFSPIADQWFESIDEFHKDFTELAKITNSKIGTIRIMGGEPLLHPSVLEFLKITRELFPNSEIQLVTNGLLIKSNKEELRNLCNEKNICVCVSNYGLNINLNELLNGFKRTRIDPKNQLYNISLDTTGNQNIEDSFKKCDLHCNHWYYFQNGRMYHCCIGANIHYFNKKFESQMGHTLEANQDEISISIYNHSLAEIEEFLSKPIPLCKYCNTNIREKTYSSFHQSKGEISEWIYR